MAADNDHMNFVNLRRLALARAAFALLASADEQEPVLKVMNAEPGCRTAAGLTTAQEASMLAAINEVPYSAQSAADVVSGIIAANHGHEEQSGAAENIDLIYTLREIELLTQFDEGRAKDILSSSDIRAKHAAAAQAIFRLREIGRMVAPLMELLAPLPSDAGRPYAEAAE